MERNVSLDSFFRGNGSLWHADLLNLMTNSAVVLAAANRLDYLIVR